MIGGRDNYNTTNASDKKDETEEEIDVNEEKATNLLADKYKHAHIMHVTPDILENEPELKKAQEKAKQEMKKIQQHQKRWNEAFSFQKESPVESQISSLDERPSGSHGRRDRWGGSRKRIKKKKTRKIKKKKTRKIKKKKTRRKKSKKSRK